MSEKEPWEIERSLQNIVGAPYTFELKNGLKLDLDEWTIDAELWSAERYGDMGTLFNRLMAIDCTDVQMIDAAVDVAVFKLTDSSRKEVDELRGKLTTENYLRKNITYRNLAGLVRAEYQMIKTSIPIEAIEAVKKNHGKLITQMQGKGASRPKPKNSRKKNKKK